MLGNLINRHDAVRLYRRVRRGQLSQMVSTVRAPGPERVLAHWSAPGHAAGQVQWDDIPAIRRRWHTFGGETTFAGHVTRRWLAGEAGRAAGVFPPSRPLPGGSGGSAPRASTGEAGRAAGVFPPSRPLPGGSGGSAPRASTALQALSLGCGVR